MLEGDGNPQRLQGKALFSAMYLNELLVRLLKPEESCEILFEDYERALAELASGQPVEVALRRFEKRLLQALGYSLSFPDVDTTEFFYFSMDCEWLPLSDGITRQQQARSFRASELQAIARDDYQDADVLRAAKRLMRLALAPLLGDKPLHSKELFMQQVKQPPVQAQPAQEQVIEDKG